ncbi:class I adenylate-forming enzyme family protein [Ekhidna sp. To15]|uniref:class I adenylate-forming enzyme family protein n=1 Tax=Ekhidna sp. To15 TaxID=3395267 RepID=UPI003F521CDD
MKNFKDLLENDVIEPVTRKIFYVSENNSYNYGSFIERIGKITTLLNQNGVVPGDRILVSISNDYDMFCVTFSLILNGATAVLIEPDTKSRRAKSIIESSRIQGCFVNKENVSLWDLRDYKLVVGLDNEPEKKGALLKKLLKKKHDSEENQTLNSLLSTLDSNLNLSEFPMQQYAVIIFTSGTTSNPKGVVLTHGNLLAHLATLSMQYEIEEKSVISNILPLYHVDGLFQGPFLAFYNKITLSRPFLFEVPRIEELLHSFYKYKVSHFFSVPTMLSFINQFGMTLSDSFDTEHFKYVISSAGHLDKSIWSNFMKRFNVRVVNVYGLTESVAGGFFCGPSDDTWRIGSIGKPVDIEVSIVDENENPVREGQIGELLLRGDNIMKSYLTASENPDENGWFHTGDLVSRDKEGFFYIKGRKKNVIVKGGVNVYPEEVIEILMLHSDIDEAFVYGESDDVWGEKTIAVIVKSSSSTLTAQDVIQHCRDYMHQVNVPDQIHFLSQFPRGKSGKVKIEQVRAAVVEMDFREIGDAETPLKENMLKIANECFGTTISEDRINAPSHSIQGWNSLEHLHFATEIEKSYKIELNTRDIMNITSISSAISIVSKKLENQ